MRLSACHPLHRFEPIPGMPPMPSLTKPAGYAAVRCLHCGLMGFHRNGDPTIILTNSNDQERQRARGCSEHSFAPTAIYAKIIAPRLFMQDTTTPLMVGSTHRVITPPSHDPSDLLGVWIDGPAGPFRLSVGEFLPIRIRNRRPRLAIL